MSNCNVVCLCSGSYLMKVITVSMSTATPTKPSPSQVVILNKAFKLVNSHYGPNSLTTLPIFFFPFGDRGILRKGAKAVAPSMIQKIAWLDWKNLMKMGYFRETCQWCFL